MVGVDLSLSPAVWAASNNGQWLFGQLPTEQESPRSLRDALSACGLRDRSVALCLPTRAIVWATIPGLRPGSRHARKAAVLAATTRLRVAPPEAVVSLSPVEGGVMYAGAERSAIEAVMAPWFAAGFAVAVIEPAAVSLLRGVASEVPVVIVRVGTRDVEIVAGSCDRLLFARHLPGAWSTGQTNAIRLELDATIEAARKEGVVIERVLVSGHGDLGRLAAALSSNARVATLASRCQAPEAPSWTIAAASAALWKTGRVEEKRRPLHQRMAAGSLRRVLSGIAAARSRIERNRAA